MSPLLTYSTPIVGNANATEDPKVRDALTAIKTEYNANIAAILGAWKPLTTWFGRMGSATVAASSPYYPQSGGNGLDATTVGSANGAQNPFYLDPADFAIAGYTTKIRIRGSVETNGTAPVSNFTLGLFPVSSVGGGAAVTALTLGAAHVSAAAINAPAINTTTPTTSAEITMPAAGLVIAAITISANTAANSQEVLEWELQYRYV